MVIMAGILPGCTGETQPTGSNVPQVQDISSREAYDLINENEGNPDFVILDVRTASEFAEGHIAGALLIDVKLASFREEVDNLDKTIHI